MEDLRPNEQRARAAIILIWIVFALEFLSLFSSFLQYLLFQAIANGEDVSMDTANANDLREAVIAILYTIVFIVSMVTFIMWFRRAYFNLHLRARHLSQSEGWAAGSWFVPIVNLFRPYQIMREMYQVTKGLLVNKGIIGNDSFKSEFLVLWWTLWILNNAVAQFAVRFAMKAESVDEFMVSTIAAMIGNLVGIPLALVAIKVIKDYSKMELLLKEVKDEDAGF